jgi:hypothetical protein
MKVNRGCAAIALIAAVFTIDVDSCGPAASSGYG